MNKKEIIAKKNKMIVEAQQILPILSPAEVEEYWGMLAPVAGEPEPKGFFPSKREMIDIFAWRLFDCTQNQVETYLNEIKQAAETRLKRKHDIMQALANAGLSTVRTDVPVPTDEGLWFTRLAISFSDRYGCLVTQLPLPPNEDYGEDDSCGDEQTLANFGFYGTYVFASACAKYFSKAYSFAKRQCEKIAADAKKSGICEDEIEAICEAYGYGFYNGVSETFSAQWLEEMKQGLYLVVPQAIGDYKELVEEDCDFVMYPDLSSGKYGLAYMEGVRNGRKSALSTHS